MTTEPKHFCLTFEFCTTLPMTHSNYSCSALPSCCLSHKLFAAFPSYAAERRNVNDAVECVCGVCVCVCGGSWFTASPGPSQTDWTLGWLGGGGAAHLWCIRAIQAPRINQLSPHTHTLRGEPLSWQQHVTNLLGVLHLTVSNKCILQTQHLRDEGDSNDPPETPM